MVHSTEKTMLDVVAGSVSGHSKDFFIKVLDHVDSFLLYSI